MLSERVVHLNGPAARGVIFHRARCLSFFLRAAPAPVDRRPRSISRRPRTASGHAILQPVKQCEVLSGRVARTPLSVIALQPETGDSLAQCDNTVRVVQRNLSFLAMSFITDAATPCSALRVAPSAFPSLGRPRGQSSLVMGSPFIKMIFSLLNCAATATDATAQCRR